MICLYWIKHEKDCESHCQVGKIILNEGFESSEENSWNKNQHREKKEDIEDIISRVHDEDVEEV